MSDQYTYARFWRCALQVNPVSYNGTYRGVEHGLTEVDYNQSLLEKCIELDIKVVGVADHGSVESVDSLRQVAGLGSSNRPHVSRNRIGNCTYQQKNHQHFGWWFLSHLSLLRQARHLRPAYNQVIQTTNVDDC